MCYGFDPGFHIEKGEHEEAIFDFIVPKGQKLYIFRFSSFPRTIERRGATHVTMVALFLGDNKTTTTGTARRTAKNISTNNNFARASRYFVHFFAVVAPLQHEIS